VTVAREGREEGDSFHLQPADIMQKPPENAFKGNTVPPFVLTPFCPSALPPECNTFQDDCSEERKALGQIDPVK
jgi:hypothetical protein